MMEPRTPRPDSSLRCGTFCLRPIRLELLCAALLALWPSSSTAKMALASPPSPLDDAASLGTAAESTETLLVFRVRRCEPATDMSLEIRLRERLEDRS